MTDQLKKYCKHLTAEFDLIPPERKVLLEKISSYIRQNQSENKSTNLVYICTHNSRRSHFGQIWSNLAADYFGIANVYTYSGGTEVTAFHPNAIEALKRAGFLVKKKSDAENPVYEIRHDENAEPTLCFSKLYNHPNNPNTRFAAIMTCSDAEENCPFIPNVELRIATTYNDPKSADNTDRQNDVYDERCRQIARETLYVFAKIKSNGIYYKSMP